MLSTLLSHKAKGSLAGVLLLILTLVLSACSLDSLSTPTTRATATSGVAEAIPSATTGASKATATTTVAQATATTALAQATATTLPNLASQLATAVPTAQATIATGTALSADPRQQPIVQIAQKVGPAVVTVVNQLDPSQTGYSGGEALGTGIVVDTDGHIFTNNHVIAGAAQNGLSVIFSDGASVAATLVGADEVSDLAVLKVDQPVTATVSLGDSDSLLPGETVIAIGSALGDFQNTITMGIISGLNRTLPGAVGTDIEPMIQTDAAINHGNSGGPLIDLSGNVIGINTAVVRSTDTSSQSSTDDVAEGLGFAIPINTVKKITAQLISQGQVPRPYLGIIDTYNVTRQLSAYYRLRDENGMLLESGALVTQIARNSPAALAGIRAGDVITQIDDQVIDTENPLANVLLNYQPNTDITLTVIRNGKKSTIKVTLTDTPSQ